MEECSVKKKDPFSVEFTDDNRVGITLSEEFLSLSAKEQTKRMREFFWQKTSEPDSVEDIGRESVRKEVTIILAETLLNKLTRGEILDGETKINISLEELMTPTYSIVEGFVEEHG
jgi:hypothetical protein